MKEYSYLKYYQGFQTMWRLFDLVFCWPVLYFDPHPSPLLDIFCFYMCVFEEHGCGGGSSVTGEGVLSHGAVDRQETDEPCRCLSLPSRKNENNSPRVDFFFCGARAGEVYIHSTGT